MIKTGQLNAQLDVWSDAPLGGDAPVSHVGQDCVRDYSRRMLLELKTRSRDLGTLEMRSCVQVQGAMRMTSWLLH